MPRAAHLPVANSAPAAASPPRSLAGIQILRGLAAIAVVIHHVLEESLALPLTTPPPQWLILVGAAGVDVFFVISGFIMFYTAAHRFGTPGAAPDFLARRLIRVMPLYWLCSLAVLGLALTGLAYKSKVLDAGGIAASLLLLPTDNLLLGVGWTLQYEMYFYLLFAACLTALSARAALVVLPLALVAGIALGHALPDSAAQRFMANPIALEFCFGLWLAHGFLSGWLPRIGPRVLGALGVAGLVAASILARQEGTAGFEGDARFLAWGIPAALVVWAALGAGAVRGRVGRVLLLAGDASYSIYLTHALVMTAYARLIKTSGVADLLPPWAWMTAVVGVAVAVGLVTYLAVERPLGAWLKRRGESAQRRAAERRDDAPGMVA